MINYTNTWYIFICMQNQRHTIRTSDIVLWKIYLSLYCKVCVWEGAGDQQDCNILTPTLMVISVLSFSFSRAAPWSLGSWGPASLGAVLFTSSCHQRVWSPNSLGVPRAPSAGWWLSLPHLVSNSSDLLLTDFLSSPSYIIVQSPTQS